MGSESLNMNINMAMFFYIWMYVCDVSIWLVTVNGHFGFRSCFKVYLHDTFEALFSSSDLSVLSKAAYLS